MSIDQVQDNRDKKDNGNFPYLKQHQMKRATGED